MVEGDQVQFLDNVLDGGDSTRKYVESMRMNMDLIYVVENVTIFHDNVCLVQFVGHPFPWFDTRRLTRAGGPW